MNTLEISKLKEDDYIFVVNINQYGKLVVFKYIVKFVESSKYYVSVKYEIKLNKIELNEIELNFLKKYLDDNFEHNNIKGQHILRINNLTKDEFVKELNKENIFNIIKINYQESYDSKRNNIFNYYGKLFPELFIF